MADRPQIEIGTCPSVAELQQVLRLDAQTGHLFWLSRPVHHFRDERSWKSWNSKNAGNRALAGIDSRGYLFGRINDRNYRAHRVVFALHHGRWPSGLIDHINQDRMDNRPQNLREATVQENARNQRRGPRNTSGALGVRWQEQRQKWMVTITVSQKEMFLGRFSNRAEAIAARRAAEIAHGFHPNHGERAKPQREAK